MPKITKLQPSVPALPTRKKVAAYARVSVTRDRTEHSLSAQISHYSEYIQHRAEWEYAGVYADLGQTGTSDNRAEWQRLLADCEAGKIDIVLTKSISRFARNTLDLLETVRRLREIGVEVRFEKENISSTSGDGELMLTILASFAQEESYSTSENIKWRIRSDFKKGKQSSTQIYGYRWNGETFDVEPNEAEIVRFIFSEYLAEKSPRTIADELTARGVKSMYGSNFDMATIFSMLQNEKYVGTVVMQKTFVENHITKNKVKNNGELPRYVIENAHTAIVDRAVFDEVQARLQSRKIVVERTAFTSKILCEVCGCNFQRATKQYHGRKTKVMTCANKKAGAPCKCDTVQIPETILESVTAEVLGLAEFDAEVFNAKIKRIIAPSSHTLVYEFTSGKTMSREWSSTARTDCWTGERRAEQAERMRGQVVSAETREKRRVATLRSYEQHPERRAADRERMRRFCAENPDWGKAQNEKLLAAIKAKKEDGGNE
jgi:DNA invertase Pin-like site-specific DNA recombinase